MAHGFKDGEWQDGELRGLTFVAGERGMGKTTLMLRRVFACTGPVLFFDTVGTHAHILKARGFVEFTQPGALRAFLAASNGRGVRVVYVPRDESPEKHLRCVCLLARAFGTLWARVHGDRGGLILCVDEIDVYCGEEHGSKWMPKQLYDLAHFGRHYHVSMACTAREPKSLSKKFRSQCAQMCIFRVSEEDDVKFFAGRIGRAAAAKLRTLQKTFYLHWKAGVPDALVCGGPSKL